MKFEKDIVNNTVVEHGQNYGLSHQKVGLEIKNDKYKLFNSFYKIIYSALQISGNDSAF